MKLFLWNTLHIFYFHKTASVIAIDNIDENTAMNKNDKIRLYLWPTCRLKLSCQKHSCDGSDIYCSSVCSLKETRQVNEGTRNHDIT